MKYLRLASDLHLEAFSGRTAEKLADDFLPKDERDADSVLVLAGDISSIPDQLVDFIREVEDRFIRVVYIPGNHESYRHNFQKWNAFVNDVFPKSLKNTVFTDLESVRCYDIDGVRFILGTLWGDGGKDLQEQSMVGRYLNDFRLIGFHKNDEIRNFRVSDMMELNRQQKAKIQEYLEQEWFGPVVVVSHHLPSYSLCHPRFGTECSGGFASACDDLIDDRCSPDVWCFGHTHDSMDSVIGLTRVVCNPRGYRGEWGTQYNQYEAKFIEIDS
jgi:DNA repair exonuclease SbcCD nuclease subunit